MSEIIFGIGVFLILIVFISIFFNKVNTKSPDTYEIRDLGIRIKELDNTLNRLTLTMGSISCEIAELHRTIIRTKEVKGNVD